MPFEQIADLGPELLAAESELSSLAAAWEDRQSDLEEHAALTEMRQRMRRRWAIETGMIEGLYALDRGTTQLLIDRGLHSDLISHGDSDQPAEAVVAYLQDQAGVYDWLFDFIRSERVLSTLFVKASPALDATPGHHRGNRWSRPTSTRAVAQGRMETDAQ
jgi:hypothetical protein